MSDIFREVEEDVRREKFEKLWKVWGNTIIALLVLVFLGIGGWQLYERHAQQEREKAAAQFIAAQRISSPRDGAAAMSDLAKDAPGGYAELAKLSQAGAMFASGQQKDAVDLYKAIAAEDSGAIGMAARLRAAWAMADTTTRNDLAALLEPLNKPGSAWRENAQEVLAYADYRALDNKSALARYSQLANDAEAPEALRARAKAMAAFLKNGGAVNFGTVPPEAKPEAPAPEAAAPAPAKP